MKFHVEVTRSIVATQEVEADTVEEAFAIVAQMSNGSPVTGGTLLFEDAGAGDEFTFWEMDGDTVGDEVSRRP